MVSTTEVGGGNTPNGLAARKNQPKSNNKKPVGFKGDAKVKKHPSYEGHYKWIQSVRANHNSNSKLMDLRW